MKQVLVTGGDGFIGTYLCRELTDSGYKVVVYGERRPADTNLEYVEGDILEEDRLEGVAREVDTIFHLAGVLGTEYLVERSRAAVDVNIHGSLNIFDLARVLDKKVINISLIPEWDNPYMITKKAAMRFGRMYHKEFGTDISTLEFSHAYGPGQRVQPYYKAIPTFITRALSGEPITIFGAGRKYMDCIYVTDVTKALRLAGESSSISGEVIQVGSGKGIKVIDLAKKIIHFTNSASKIEFRPMRKGEPEDEETRNFRYVSLEHWLKYFEWKPEIPLDEGLNETIQWYMENLSNLT